MSRVHKATIALKIEKLREELVLKGINRGLNDPQVIAASKKLDKLINQYYRLNSDSMVKSK